MRELKKKDLLSNKERILLILQNVDSIAYNILLVKGYEIEKIYNEIFNTSDS